MYTERKNCRACGSTNLESVFSLGMQYVIDFVKEKSADALIAPLELVLCHQCALVQLRHSVDQDRLYKKFWYRSGVSEVMRVALRNIANAASVTASLEPNDSVLDIGCNDGTLLSMVPAYCSTVGIDPCRELVQEGVASDRMDIGIVGYFSKENVQAGLKRHAGGLFKAITAVAMFYDLDDPKSFLQDCKSLLHPQGVLIIQMNYLYTMIKNSTLDNISHEHLAYYSLTSLKRLVESCGLEIVGAEMNSVNGGSFRVYITHEGGDISSYRIPTAKRVEMYARMAAMLREESQFGLDTTSPYIGFSYSCQAIRTRLRNYLLEAHKAGKKIYSYGASTRGAVLMQYLDLPEGLIIAAAERDPHKFGLMTVGTWIPITNEETCRKGADVFFVQPYHFWEGIQKRERTWIEKGGTFVVPLPEPMVYSDAESYSLMTGAEAAVSE